ncbi:IS110 family transposase [Geodermatophilus sp. FMUSA9-8]|uniref:IS110 family transposase n=1 Tax=Geodermatophilus sp. FMUSA9-8 TaxID=3120155 RepID=UPI003008744A
MHAGIDTHKDTLAVAVIDDAGRPLVVTELANTEAGFAALEKLLAKHVVQRVGIEGSGNYGRGTAVHLVLTGPARGRRGATVTDQPGAVGPAGRGQDRPD